MNRLPIAIAGVLWGLTIVLHGPELSAADSPLAFADYSKSVEPFFRKHCIRCHGSKTSEGEVRLDQLSPLISDEQMAERWQEVLDVLNAGDMPPEDQPQPKRDEFAGLIGTLTDGLFKARKRLVDSRHVTLRRLNKREYANTIRHLLGVPVDTKGLPADGMVEGFDTIGDAHFMSTVQFEKYLELGREALNMALVNGPKPERTVIHNEPERSSNDKVMKAIRDKSKLIAERKSALRDKSLSKEERQRLESRLNLESKGVEGAKGYQSQPAAQTGFILGITRQPFGG